MVDSTTTTETTSIQSIGDDRERQQAEQGDDRKGQQTGELDGNQNQKHDRASEPIKTEQHQLSKDDAGERKQEDKRPEQRGTVNLQEKVDVTTFKVADIHQDPKRFQYKSDTDSKTGASEKLKDRVYQDALAGVITIWKDPADGKFYVINGHHRLDLAKRNNVQSINVQIIGGESAQDARVLGALQNIAEGQGTVIDAAKIFRDMKFDISELTKVGLSLTDSKTNDGMALSNLSQDLFDNVVNGMIAPSVGIIIGRNIKKHSVQEQFIKHIKGRKLNNSTIEVMAKDINASPVAVTKVVDLFGTTETEQAEYEERAKIIGEIINALSKVKNLLGKTAKGKEFLEQFGNKINEEKSKGASQDAAIASVYFDRLRHSDNNITQIINDTVNAIKKGEKRGSAIAKASELIIDKAKNFFQGDSKQTSNDDAGEGKQEATPEQQATANLLNAKTTESKSTNQKEEVSTKNEITNLREEFTTQSKSINTKNTLNRKNEYEDGAIKTRAENIEELANDGIFAEEREEIEQELVKEDISNPYSSNYDPNINIIYRGGKHYKEVSIIKYALNGYYVTKTEYDYSQFLKEKLGSNKQTSNDDVRFNATNETQEATPEQQAKANKILDYLKKKIPFISFITDAKEYADTLSKVLDGNTTKVMYIKVQGDVLGFVYGGKIYLDATKLTPETLAEEFTHLQQQALRLASKQGNKQAQKIVQAWDNATNKLADALISGNLKAKELLIELGISESELESDVYKQQAGENKTAYKERLQDEIWAKAQKVEFAKHLERLSKENKFKATVNKMIDALKDFAKYVGKQLGIYNAKEWDKLSLSELIERTNKELAGDKFLKGLEQNRIKETERKQTEWSNNLQKANDKFNEELSNFDNLSENHIFKLGTVGDILKSVGIKNLPIELSRKLLNNKSSSDYKNNHPFDVKTIKDLAKAIQDPIAIFHNPNKDGHIILTELQQDGVNHIAVIKIRTERGANQLEIENNNVVTIFPKDRIEDVTKWIKDEKGLGSKAYFNKEKSLAWLSDNETQLRLKGFDTKDLAKVIKDFENPISKNEVENVRFQVEAWHGSPHNIQDGFKTDDENAVTIEEHTQFKKSQEQHREINQKNFDTLIEKLKKPFAKAFEKLNVTHKWNDFVEKHEALKRLGSLENMVFAKQLEAVNNKFNDELKKLINGTLPKGHIFQLGKAGDVLKSAGIEDLPIELSSDRAKEKSEQKNHPFNLEDLTGLSKAIQNPIAVFDSTKKDGTKVILTELQDNKGNNYVVALRVSKSDTKRTLQIEVNDVKSIYPKDNVSGIIDWINSKDNLLRYVDKEKANAFIQSQSTNLIGTRAESKGLDISVQSTNLIGNGNIANKQQFNSAEVTNATKVIKDFENPISDKDVQGVQYALGFHGSPHLFEEFSNGWLYSGEGASGFGEGFYFTESKDDANDYARKLDKGDGKARVYKSKIPDLIHYFDISRYKYNKEQSKEVQNAILKIDDATAQKILNSDDATAKDLLQEHSRTFFDAIQENLYNNDYSAESKASAFLENLGIKGNTHTEFGLRHFIVFNPENIEIKQRSRVQFMHTPKGEVYGAKLPDGTIYINPEKLNANTPIHEFSHLWEQIMPNAWKKGLEIFKQTKTGRDLVEKLKKDGNYENLSEEQLWSESMNTLIGNLGESKYHNPKGKMAEFIDWVKDTLAKFINTVTGNKELNKEYDLKDFTNKVLGDLLGDKLIKAESVKANDTAIQYAKDYGKKSDFNADGTLKESVRKEIEEERNSIIEKAKADGTYKKAPNGEKTNLNEEQWVTVRTSRFKDWFGDWENGNKLDLIENNKPTPINPNNYSVKQIEEIYHSLDNGVNKYDNKNVRFVNSTLGKLLRHKGFDTKQIIPQLKQIFDNAVPILSETEQAKEGHKQHTNFKGYHHYLGKIKVDGKEMYVRFTVQELNAKAKTLKDGFIPNELHSTFVSDIEIYNANSAVISGKSPATNTGDGVIDTKLQHFFEKARNAKENSSKVIDENGEPLVVYHGTSSEFNVFNVSEDGDFGKGIYFGTTNEDAKTYARIDRDMNNRGGSTERTVSGFLNFKNPYMPSNWEWKNETFDSFTDLDTRKELQERGFDGIVVMAKIEKNGKYTKATITNKDNILEIVAFSPNQIKSATSNVGTFCNESNDIRFQVLSEAYSTQILSTDAEIEQSRQRLEQAWNNFKSIGIASTPENEVKKHIELLKALFDYAIRKGAKNISDLKQMFIENVIKPTLGNANLKNISISTKIESIIEDFGKLLYDKNNKTPLSTTIMQIVKDKMGDSFVNGLTHYVKQHTKNGVFNVKDAIKEFEDDTLLNDDEIEISLAYFNATKEEENSASEIDTHIKGIQNAEVSKEREMLAIGKILSKDIDPAQFPNIIFSMTKGDNQDTAQTTSDVQGRYVISPYIKLTLDELRAISISVSNELRCDLLSNKYL